MTTETPTAAPLGRVRDGNPARAASGRFTTCRGGFDDADVSRVHELYELEWFSQGRTLDEVRKLLDHSVVVCLRERSTGQIVSTIRAVTDRVTYGIMLDLVVDPAQRGNGLGTATVEALLADPRLTDLHAIGGRMEPHLHGYYERWGFELLPPGKGHRMLKRLRGSSDRDGGGEGEGGGS